MHLVAHDIVTYCAKSCFENQLHLTFGHSLSCDSRTACQFSYSSQVGKVLSSNVLVQVRTIQLISSNLVIDSTPAWLSTRTINIISFFCIALCWDCIYILLRKSLLGLLNWAIFSEAGSFEVLYTG